MSYCDDCGTKRSDGVCSNCEEELFIENTQNEFIENRSEEWIEKVADQAAKVKERNTPK